LPFFDYDLIFKSEPNILDKFKNERDKIFNNIIQNGSVIRIEGNYKPVWGILATQDCDIALKEELTFFLLNKIKKIDENISSQIRGKIINSTRKLYLPKLDLNKSKQYGPFEIDFKTPFNITYDIILKNLQNCWKARIIESARKVFLGKLSNYFLRPPVDEIIFLENYQIINYISTIWKDFWDKKSRKNEILFKYCLNKVINIINTLIYVKRANDISKIFYFDLELISRVKNILVNIEWFKDAKSLISFCSDIQKKYIENPNDSNQKFISIFNRCFKKINDNIISNFLEFYNTNEIEIKELRKLENKDLSTELWPESILAENKSSKDCADGCFNAKKKIEELPDYLYHYLQIYRYLSPLGNNQTS